MKILAKMWRLAALAFVLGAAQRGYGAGYTNLTTLSIAASEFNAVVARSDGTVWTWGTNQFGQLGTAAGPLLSSSVPLQIPGIANAIAVATGDGTSLALLADGRVFAWGLNSVGQLGNGGTANSTTPVQVVGITDAVAISAGEDFCMALLSDGTVRTWGNNVVGELGNPSVTPYTNAPVKPSGANLAGIVAIAAGSYHALALRGDGTVWSWGDNNHSQLGNGTFSDSYCSISSNACTGVHFFGTATSVAGLTGVVAIGAGYTQSMFVKSDGTLYICGGNTNGELGLGTIDGNERCVPVQVPGMSNIVSATGNIWNSLAADSFGNVFEWGFTGFTNQPVPSPRQLANLPPIRSIGAGNDWGFGQALDGSIYTWGPGLFGVSGNDTSCYAIRDEAPRYSTGPYPVGEPGPFSRGNVDTPDYTSIVIPFTQQLGVRIDPIGTNTLKFGQMTPWLFRTQTNACYQAFALTNGTSLSRNWVRSPIAAFGSELGGTPIYPGPSYSFGVYAGGLDETSTQSTNTFSVLVYDRSDFSGGSGAIAPIATTIINIPRRTVDTAAWSNFVANGYVSTVSAYGLTTTVEFEQGQINSLGQGTWGLSWQTNPLSNFQLTGYKITHVATGTATNYHFVIQGRGSVPTGNTTKASFATDGGTNWAYAPLYALDFQMQSPLRAQFLNQPHFAGVPMPPSYSGKSPTEPAGLAVTITNNIWITNNVYYTNIDCSPELRQHPLLDQLVADLNSDPLKIASYVVNEIALTDPLGLVAGGDYSNWLTVNEGGVNRSALGTYLEGQGSPAEQCALLVYLLRKAGYPAAFVWPTNNNLFLLDSRLSDLLRMQIQDTPDQDLLPYVVNELVPVNYPWVVANVNGQSIQIFPWLKDTQVTQGLNVYDYLPAGYNSGFAWMQNYLKGDANILSLDTNNTPLVLFPAFATKYVQTNAPGLSLDDMGTVAVNRRHEYARWQDLPLPDVFQNQSQVVVFTNLSASSPYLTSIFGTFQVRVYAGTTTNGTKVMDTGAMRTCDLNNRKFLLFTNNASTLELWLAGYRPGVTNTWNFTNDTSLLNTQVLTHAISGQTNYTVLMTQQRQPAFASQAGVAFLGFEPGVNIPYDPFNCTVADLAAITINLGQVTPAMLKEYSDSFSQQQDKMDGNLSYLPSEQDYMGTVAYLLGLNYFTRESSSLQLFEQLNSVQTLSQNGAGLATLTKDATGTNVNGRIDMALAALLGGPYGGRPSGTTQMNSEDQATAWDNFTWLWLGVASAEEHQTINLTLNQTHAVSTVRLLQLAQQRATNGNAGVLELTRGNYLSVGNSAPIGWGSTVISNKDAAIWSQIVAAFNRWDADYLRIFITPGIVTNETGTYHGMGALIVGKDGSGAALISGPSVPIHGGIGPLMEIPDAGYENFQIDWGGYASDFSLPYSVPVLDPGPYAPYVNDIDFMNPTTQTYLDDFTKRADYPVPGYQNFVTVNNTGDTGPTSDQQSLLSAIADPVNVVSGEFYIDAVDLTLPGPFPLQIRRNYLSQNLSFINGLGTGWKLNVVPYLMATTNTNSVVFLYAAEMDGSVVAYRYKTNGLYIVTPQDNPMVNNQSVRGIGSTANLFNASIQQYTNSGTTYFALYGADGSVRTFQQESFAVTNGTNILPRTRPYLLTWQDHRGNTLTFTFGTNWLADDYGQMNRIQSSNGDFLGFDYDPLNRIVDAYTGDGRYVNYTYDAFDDLVGVTLPDQSQFTYTYAHNTYTTTNASIIYTNLESNHLLVYEYQPEGRVLENIYDAQRRVVTQLATVGPDLSLYTNAVFIYTNQFDNTNNASFSTISGSTWVYDFFGHTNIYQYSAGLITSVVDPLNYTASQTWWPTNATAPGYPRSLKQTIDKRGLVSNYSYDNQGNVTSTLVYVTNTVASLVQDLTGNGAISFTNQATYSTNNVPTVITDALGNQTQVTYSTGDPYLPARIVRTAGSTPVSTNILTYGNVSSVISDGVHSFTNAAFGLLLQVVRASTATNLWTYDGRGFPIYEIKCPTTADNAFTDPTVTNFFYYNDRGLLEQVTNLLGWTSLFGYDPLGRPESRSVFDSSGNLLSQEFLYYNGNGEMNWYDGPRYNPEDYVYHDYDGAGRLTTDIRWRSFAQDDASGMAQETGNDLYASTFHYYDGFGNETNTVDPLGNYTSMGYDANGQLISRAFYSAAGALMATNGFKYEPGGQVTLAVNALGGSTSNIYNVAGRLVGRINPDGSTNGWYYDLFGRTVRSILPNGNYWQITYDDANKIVTSMFNNSGGPLATNSIQFDNRGNAISKTDALGNISTNLFDGLDRIKVAAGPAIVTLLNTNATSPTATNYVTNIVQQLTGYVYDAYGQTLTMTNALGEQTVVTRDALGRPTQVAVNNAGGGSPVRVSTSSYSADHNSVTTTIGSGANAIVTTTYSDTQNHPALTTHYPVSGLNAVLEYELNRFDVAGNRIAWQQASSRDRQINVWATNGWTYDGLNRVATQTSRDGALTSYSYDSLGDITSMAMPGSLTWSATYLNDGRRATEQESGGGQTARLMSYGYFAANAPFAGMLYAVTNGNGTVSSNTYDDFFRVASVTTTGALSAQQTTTTYEYDLLNDLTNLSQSFASNTTGPDTVVSRTYDSYRHITSEVTTMGDLVFSGAVQIWDAAGRRVGLNDTVFAYQADGLMTGVADESVIATYGYANNGLLATRTNNWRTYAVTQRDGRGRVLSTQNSVGIGTPLTESFSWRGDGRLSAYTATRSDFTDARNYSYSPFAQRLSQESFAVGAGTNVTFNYTNDNGGTGGLGVLTGKGGSGVAASTWNVPTSGGLDGLGRVSQSTDTVINRSAFGHAPGAQWVSATLDGKPVGVDYDTSLGGGAWRANLDLAPGAHTLSVSAVDSSGAFTGSTNSTFTVTNTALDTIRAAYDGNGNITNRVWVNALGQTNRAQALVYDAFDRLIAVTDRDPVANGFNWNAVFDGLGRRISTAYSMVISNVPIITPPNAESMVYSTYDPQVQFLETAVEVNGVTTFKSYGPDGSGVYGGMQGVGGLEAVRVDGYFSGVGLLQDYFGNVLGTIASGISWNPDRFSAYGPVVRYQQMPLSLDSTVANSLGWKGHRVDETGLIWMGARHYDPFMGRFTSADPLGHSASMDLYSYCGGDPVNFADPDGRMAKQAMQAVNSAVNAAGVAMDFLNLALNAISGINATSHFFDNLAGMLNQIADNSTSPSKGAVAAGAAQIVTQVGNAVNPNSYVSAVRNFGDNIMTVNRQAGTWAAISYGFTSWNVGAVWSGWLNVDQVNPNKEVGDWTQRGTVIANGVGGTAGIVTAGLGLVGAARIGAGGAAASETGGSIRLWHGTSSGNASSILANGFQAGADGAVFLADDVSTARFYGLQTGAVNGQPGVVLQFTIPQSLADDLGLSTSYEMGEFRGFRPLDIPGASGTERIMLDSSISTFNQALQDGTITWQSFLLRPLH